MMRAVYLALLGFSLSLAVCRAAMDQRVLVLGSPDLESTHSAFLQSLRQRGYMLDLELGSEDAPKLKEWDDWLFDKLIVFSHPKIGKVLKALPVLEFIDSGHDVLFAVDGNATDDVRDLITECGVDLDARGTAVIEHFSYVLTDANDRSLVLSDQTVKAPAIISPAVQGPVLFNGIAASISKDSETAFSALTGSPSAYSAKPGVALTGRVLAGSDLSLVSLVQTRNNARVGVSGSIDLFSDAFFKAGATTVDRASIKRVANEAFAADVTKWVFQERGRLNATRLRHRHAGTLETAEQPSEYRIKDDIKFAIDIHELVDGQWQPYRADDVQLELVMLDPYIRTTLKHDGKGTFFAHVKLPDVYGVFKFVLDYKRLGYSYLDLSHQIPIRPFKHNEYERFIVSAYPYYTSALSVMIAFCTLSFVFLYHK